ncbi:MAG TPA: ABC transporter substrate-binding protein [Candidatus Nanopelagicaceae bacterium]|nr:ABC transporter substrate-binding protein [Candidatus Nanopelagicaceae bacterium]
MTFAEQAAAPPNYIFPLMSGNYFDHNNLPFFDYLMYRPLYWFGLNGEPVVNPALSMADPPVFSANNTVATVTLKHWLWSDGQPVTARDVIFWMNLLSAATDPAAPTVGSTTAPGPGWGAAVPGGFPQNVVSYHQTGTYTVVFDLNASYNPTWYLYNELSQITALPQHAWDKLSTAGSVGSYDVAAAARVLAPASAGLPASSYVPSNPGTATTGALGVAQFLNSQAQDLTTYSTNRLWQVVDGPFKLNQFTTSGYVKMIPNRAYSGSPKPRIAAFVEEPFTTDTAEFNTLRSGGLTIGYIPVQDLSQAAALERAQGYSLAQWHSPTFVYFPYNFTNPTVGPVFKQLYFRQAFQSLVNQPQYIKEFSANLGVVNNGPAPEYPPGNPVESPLQAKGLYPYDASKAVSLLKGNGWTVVPGGTSYCSAPGTGPGECGAGIASHAPASFSLLYASGSVQLTNEMEAMQSTMRSVAGITLSLTSAPFSQVIGTVFAGCSDATPCKNWELADWGGGWNYNPDNFPTGGEIFATGAGSNAGDYSSPTNNANIAATHTAPTNAAEYAALFKYEDYLVQQLPVVWMPDGPYQLTMYKSSLKGVLSRGVAGFKIYPEFYYFRG